MALQADNHTQLTPENLLGFEVNRCYRSKVQCKPGDELYLALENTHRIFNEKVALVVRHIQAVLSNKENTEFAKLTQWAILNISPAGQCASHFANPFIRDSEAGPKHPAYKKAPEMEELFYRCKERGDRWYDRDELFGTEKGVSGFATEVNQAAIEKVSAYLKLKDLWRNGDFKPPELLVREDFVKTYSTFFKKNRDIFEEEDSRGFECLTELLELKDAKLKGRLADIHASQLAPEHAEILTALGRAYREYSDKAIGKDSWLKQKMAFERLHPKFLAYYQVILDAYRKTLNKNDKQTTGETDSIPRAWYRDPNFLQVIEQEGPKGSFGGDFTSPLQDAATQKEWAELKTKHPEWPEFDDINKIGPHWDARLFYLNKLEELNDELFSKTGWFGLLKAFRPYEGKQYTEFRKPPALRFPDPKNHPEWLTLSDKGCFQYRNLRVIGPALIEMTTKLIDPVTNIFRDYTFQVKLDNRLKTLGAAETYEVPKGRWLKNKETGQLEFDWPADEHGELPFEKELFYPWLDKNDQKTYRISIKGGNLLHQKKAFYLHFRYTYKAPFNKGIKNLEQDNSEFSYKAGTKLLGFDLGQKSDAVIAMMQDGESVKFKPFFFKKKAVETKPVYFQWLKLPGGNSFQAINHAEKSRQKKRSKKARAEAHWRQEKKMPERKVKGLFLARNQETFKRLNRYIENCREQHCKQLAGVIVKIAKQNNCHGIVHENLENYRMSVKQRRLENRRLQTWIAQKTMDFLKTLCEAEGLLCFPKSAAMTSQTCNACMSWGVRFNIPSKAGWESRLKYRSSLAEYKCPVPLIEPGGDWFLCSNVLCKGQKEPERPNTRYIIQADANAAKNLLKRAFLKEYWGAKVEGRDEKEVKKNKDILRDELQKWLIEVYAPKLAGKVSP